MPPSSMMVGCDGDGAITAAVPEPRLACFGAYIGAGGLVTGGGDSAAGIGSSAGIGGGSSFARSSLGLSGLRDSWALRGARVSRIEVALSALTVTEVLAAL
jgi:hypothetical protein